MSNHVINRESAVTARDVNTTERRTGDTITTTTTIRTTESASFDNGVVDVGVIPYMRNLLIQFRASGLRPNRKVWFFFDDVDVTNYIIDTNEIETTANNDVVDMNDGFREPDIISLPSNNSVQVPIISRRRRWDDDDDGRPGRRRRRIFRVLSPDDNSIFWPGNTIVGSVTSNTAIISRFIARGGNRLEQFFTSNSSNTIVLPRWTRSVPNNWWGINGSNSIILIPRGWGRWRRNPPLRAFIGDGTRGFDNVSRRLYLSNTINNVITITPPSLPPGLLDNEPPPLDTPGNTISWSITGDNYVEGSGWYTDAEGEIDGIFAVPAGIFRTGERTFKIIDVPTGATKDCTTRAEYKFNSSGIKQTKQQVTINQTRTETRVSTRDVPRPPQPRRDTGRDPPVRDPIAQTFFIDGRYETNGIYVTSVGIFFRSKSEIQPVSVQIRPTVNGFPSSDQIVAVATVPSEKVLISETGTVETRFYFDAPVFLKPGEHSIVVISDSYEYEVFISEVGQKMIGSDRIISEQPYLGSFFKSQNASTWDASQLEDLKFVIYKAVYSPSGEIELMNEKPDANVDMDIMYAHLDQEMPANTSITYQASYDGGVTYFTYIPDTNKIMIDGRKNILASTNGTFRLKATMTTNDTNITPIIYPKTGALIAVENFIDNAEFANDDITITNAGLGYTANSNISVSIISSIGTSANAYATTNANGSITSITFDNVGSGYFGDVWVYVNGANTIPATAVISRETSDDGGPALAKYISRTVTLAEGFDAGELKVWLTAYKPTGTNIKVYYKVKNVNDTESFEDKNWVLMEQVTGSTIYSAIRNYNQSLEYEFRPEYDEINNTSNIEYTNNAGTATYDTFNQFAVKIVLTSNDPTNYPIVNDMRAIALPMMTPS